jgi:hypothetical protein
MVQRLRPVELKTPAVPKVPGGERKKSTILMYV